MRRWILLLGAFVGLACATHAQIFQPKPIITLGPQLDPAGWCAFATNNVSSYDIVCNTTKPNDLFIVFVRNLKTGAPAPAATVTDGGSAGLTFVQRTVKTNSYVSASCDLNGDCQDEITEWCAPVTGTLTNEHITISLDNSSFAGSGALGAGISLPPTHDCSTAFDANPSLPAIAANTNGIADISEVTGVSTSSSPGVLLVFASNNTSGDTDRVVDNNNNRYTYRHGYCDGSFGEWLCDGQLMHVGAAAASTRKPQASLTICATFGTNPCPGGTGWVIMADAIK